MFVSAGCMSRNPDTSQLTRWIVPSKYVSASSLAELTNSFTSLSSASASFQVVEANTTKYLFVQLIPNNGLSRFECFAYEQIDTDYWHLRSAFWFHSCRSSILDYNKRGSVVDVQNAGETLFSIFPSSEKEQRESIPQYK